MCKYHDAGGRKMTNRQWLNNMAMIDRLNIIIQSTDNCVLRLLNQNYDLDRCEKFITKEGLGSNSACYDCVIAWLNEERE